MCRFGKYTPSDSMSDLICDNYPMLLVMSRFGIDLGFGDATIAEVCEKSGVDISTFLAVVNILIAEDRRSVEIDYGRVSLSSMMQYLHNSHSYFLEYRLPMIRRELTEVVGSGDDAVSIVIVNYYDEYVAEVYRHMMYEENTLFPYIKSIMDGSSESKRYSVDIYSEHHDKVAAKLSELKSILIKYYPAKSTNELNNVLYDIFSCERDLASHNEIEDLLLVPVIRVFEMSNK